MSKILARGLEISAVGCNNLIHSQLRKALLWIRSLMALKGSEKCPELPFSPKVGYHSAHIRPPNAVNAQSLEGKGCQWNSPTLQFPGLVFLSLPSLMPLWTPQSHITFPDFEYLISAWTLLHAPCACKDCRENTTIIPQNFIVGLSCSTCVIPFLFSFIIPCPSHTLTREFPVWADSLTFH